MAKLTVDTSKTFDFRSDSVTVKAALAFIARQKYTGDEDAEQLSRADLAGWAICYAARRIMALSKDQKRFDEGRKPEHVYTARVQVDGAAQNAVETKEAARTALARALKLGSPAPAPARKPRKRKAHAA